MNDTREIIYSDEELLARIGQDVTDLFKNYTYRYHPMTKPTAIKAILHPYLDMEEGYVKNIPVKYVTEDGDVLFEATPDQTRFREVKITTFDVTITDPTIEDPIDITLDSESPRYSDEELDELKQRIDDWRRKNHFVFDDIEVEEANYRRILYDLMQRYFQKDDADTTTEDQEGPFV